MTNLASLSRRFAPESVNRLFRVLSALAFIAALPPSPSLADERPDPQVAARMSLAEAREVIQKGFRWNFGGGGMSSEGVIPGTMEFTPESIKLVWYSSPPQSRSICGYEAFDPLIKSESIAVQGFHKGQNVFVVESASHEHEGCIAQLGIEVPTHDLALQVAAAFLRWKNSTLGERQGLNELERQRFARVVASYQATTPKPEIAEDVRRFRVIADAAIQDKRFSDAIDAYEDGLKLAPWWPEGHFNAALALGELHYYDEAIDHMKKYIDLVPNAPDTRAAQDKIYIWQGARQALPQ